MSWLKNGVAQAGLPVAKWMELATAGGADRPEASQKKRPEGKKN